MTKPREWILKWDFEYQYTDGVPADVLIARGDGIDEHERVKVIEKSAYDALEARLAEREAEFGRLKTKCNEYLAQLEDNEWKIEKALRSCIKELEAEVETQTGIANRLMKQVEQLEAEVERLIREENK